MKLLTHNAPAETHDTRTVVVIKDKDSKTPVIVVGFTSADYDRSLVHVHMTAEQAVSLAEEIIETALKLNPISAEQ
jgi:uncharacterized protein YifN (PemK superfamily)